MTLPYATTLKRPVRTTALTAPWVRLVREGVPTVIAPVRVAQDVADLMMPIAGREETEVSYVLVLNSQHRVTAMQEVTRGILNASLVHPREVFRAAIALNAAAIIAVHNHPSGDPTPSPDDRAITAQLVAAGKLLDIPVVDHVIIGSEQYFSFSEEGIL